jgi:hypothetical protein
MEVPCIRNNVDNIFLYFRNLVTLLENTLFTNEEITLHIFFLQLYFINISVKDKINVFSTIMI